MTPMRTELASAMPSSEVVLPELRIEPKSLSQEALAEVRGEGPRLALIFAAEAELFQSTVHQLQVDADVVAVLGVHADWRTRDCRHARRALLVDTEGLVSQCSFERPVRMDAVWSLHLPIECERALHASISADCERAGLLQINPYRASERADDKLRSHQLWAAHLQRGGEEFALPAATIVPREASAPEAADELRRFVGALELPATLIAQPNRGTEGQQVAAARTESADIDSVGPKHPLVRHLCDAILPTDDALLRQERGNVRVAGLRRIAFRLNVAWNGANFVAESGFAQVAAGAHDVVASRGREGAVAEINECLAQLRFRAADGWRRFVPSAADIAALQRAAVAAAEALNADLEENEYLKHMGIDMVLEVGAESGKLTPVLLEANARPAGLNQSTALRGIAPGPPLLHVTTALFDFVQHRARA